MRPGIAIVIPTRNRPGQLGRCLDSLLGSLGDEHPEIVVVDDGSDPGHAVENRRVCSVPGVRCLRVEKNQGPAAARNHGIEATRGEWIAFLDDDVCVEPEWFVELTKAVAEAGPAVVGIEGCTSASGTSLWDREVENKSGGLYLTSNIAYRRDALADAGGFDTGFAGPCCEDQELAARMLRRGEIRFVAQVRVVHQPREVIVWRYIAGSVRRSMTALKSEYRFWSVQRDRYHCFRKGRTFWHTLARLASRQVLIGLKRRGVRKLAAHPVQSAALLIGELIEQATAIIMIPWFVKEHLADVSVSMPASSELERTALLWGITKTQVPGVLRVKGNVGAMLTFGIWRRPVYRMDRALAGIGLLAAKGRARIFIRIDDVFFSNPSEVTRLCEVMKIAGAPFLAAVTGNDFLGTRAREFTDLIQEAGGETGLHGFEHAGTYGPFSSEILQMDFTQITDMIDAIQKKSAVPVPTVFVPPFNAVSWDHLHFLARYFRVITGGPESMRFADRWIGPLALPGDAWYVPALPPFYGRAKEMLRADVTTALNQAKGFVCLSFHMKDEAEDGFISLAKLISQYRDRIVSWDRITT